MKYARRSVSDADIRRYEMFSQVCAITGVGLSQETRLIGTLFVPLLRTCNNRARLATTSSSPRARLAFLHKELLLLPATQGSARMLKTTICMHKAISDVELGVISSLVS